MTIKTTPALSLVSLAALVAACAADGSPDSHESVGTAVGALTETETEPNQLTVIADPLKAADMMQGSLPVGDSDMFVSAARDDDRIYAFVDTAGNLALDTELSVFSDTSGSPFAFDDNDGPNASSVLAGVRVPSSNDNLVYFLLENGGQNVGGNYVIQSYIANSGDFGLESEPNDTVATAQPFVANRTRGELTGTGQIDYFTFSAEIGQRIAVIVDRDPLEDGSAFSNLSLRDSNDVVLATSLSSFNADGDALSWTAQYNGNYFIRLAAGLSGFGEYAVLVLVDGKPLFAFPSYLEEAQNNSLATADALKGHHPVTGSVAFGAPDVWRIVGNVGDRVYAYAACQHTTPSNTPYLRMTNESDSQIEFDGGDGPGPCPVIAGAITNTRTSYIKVGEHGDDNALDGYHLFAAAIRATDFDQHVMEGNDTLATAVPLTSVRTREAVVVDDVDYFSFEATAGENVVVIVDEAPDNQSGITLDMSLSIRDGNDVVLANGGNENHSTSGLTGNAAGPLEIPADGTYYVRLANDDQTSGNVLRSYEFVLLRSDGPVACGDGVLDGVEVCDDDGVAGGDGCNATCTAVESGWTCTGEPSVCTPICGDGVILGSEVCDDGNTTAGDGCNASCAAVEQGYTCAMPGVSCTAICGDGLLRGGEVCDDGNTTSGDGCNASCSSQESGWQCTGEPTQCVAVCGDGLLRASEQCDDGGTTPGDGCNGACLIETGHACAGEPSQCAPNCGDGLIVGSEGCDDSNTAPGDGCGATCAVETGWFCNGQPSACTPVCGDGSVQGSEACDDGNTAGGDGCNASCSAVESGYMCSGAPSMCTTSCGDGIIAGNETCDDGNAAPGDGCDAACAIEGGWSCTGEPSMCVAGCGDGVIVGGEGCDDGNGDNGDGCSNVCEVENGFTCAGDPSTCSAVCGDGLIRGAEACDDGNTSAADGCDASCMVEDGYTCLGEPSDCTDGMGAGGAGGEGAGGGPSAGSGGDASGGSANAGSGAGGGDPEAPSEDGCSVAAPGKSGSRSTPVGAWLALLGAGVLSRRRRANS